jgi:hypothetical protein
VCTATMGIGTAGRGDFRESLDGLAGKSTEVLKTWSRGTSVKGVFGANHLVAQLAVERKGFERTNRRIGLILSGLVNQYRKEPFRIEVGDLE